MSKLFAALENEQVVVDEPTEQLEQTILDQEQTVQQLEENVEQQITASDVGQTLERIEVAETDAEKVEIAKEHLLNLIGYTKQYSLESFQGDLGKGLAVAQEGFFSRIGNGFNRIFTTNKSFNKRLTAALAKLETNGNKEDLLVDPSWSKHLIATSNKVVKASEVVAFIKKVDALVSDKQLNKYLIEIASIYDKLSSELSQNTYIADKKTISAITEIHKESNELLRKFELFARSKTIVKENDDYPDYEPIDYKQAKAIGDVITRGFTANDLDTPEYRTFERAADNLNQILMSRNVTSIKTVITGLPADDVKTAYNVIARINESIYCIMAIVNLRVKMAHSALRYIEASSK